MASPTLGARAHRAAPHAALTVSHSVAASCEPVRRPRAARTRRFSFFVSQDQRSWFADFAAATMTQIVNPKADVLKNAGAQMMNVNAARGLQDVLKSYCHCRCTDESPHVPAFAGVPEEPE